MKTTITTIIYLLFTLSAFAQQSWLEKSAQSSQETRINLETEVPKDNSELFLREESKNIIDSDLYGKYLDTLESYKKITENLKKEREQLETSLKDNDSTKTEKIKFLEKQLKTNISQQTLKDSASNFVITTLRQHILQTVTDKYLNRFDEISLLLGKEKKYIGELETKLAIHKQTIHGANIKSIYQRDSLISTLFEKNKELLIKLNKADSVVINSKLKISEELNSYNSDGFVLKNLKNGQLLYENLIGSLNTLNISIIDFRKNNQEKIVAKIESLNTRKEETNGINTMPEITSTLENSGVVLPSFNILGTQELKKGGWFGNVKIFNTNINTNKSENYENLIITENSAFGIEIDLQKPFSLSGNGVNDRVALRTKLNYLNKFNQFEQKADSSGYTYGIFHLKGGLEYIVVDKVMSVYVEYNIQGPLTGINNLKKENLIYTQGGSRFINSGLRFRVKPLNSPKLGSSNNYIVFDLNLVWLNDRLKEISGKSDIALPVLKTAFSF